MPDEAVTGHDWGLDEQAAVLETSVDPGAPAGRRTGSLPEVREMRSRGYFLIPPDQPAWVFLPAVWPPSQRAWITDRTTRFETRWSDSGDQGEHEWTPDLEAEVEADSNQALAESGLSPRPARRLWFVRLPPGRHDLGGYLRSLVRRGEAAGLLTRSSSRDWVAFVRDAVSRDFDPS